MCLIAPEYHEFGPRIFNLALVSNDTVGHLMSKRLCVCLEGVSEVAGLLTRFGLLDLELNTRCQIGAE